MTKQEILALAAFDKGCSYEVYSRAQWARPNVTIAPSDIWLSSGRTENARLQPLIQALVEDRESLRDALEYVQFAHINKLERAVSGDEIQQWVLTHNANHSRKALQASDERIGKLGEK